MVGDEGLEPPTYCV